MNGLLQNLDFIHNVNESQEKSLRKEIYVIEDQFGGDKFKNTVSKKMAMSAKAFLRVQPIWAPIISTFSECDLS